MSTKNLIDSREKGEVFAWDMKQGTCFILRFFTIDCYVAKDLCIQCVL